VDPSLLAVASSSGDLSILSFPNLKQVFLAKAKGNILSPCSLGLELCSALRLAKSEDPFHTAQELLYGVGKSAFYRHICFDLVSIPHKHHNWEEIMEYLTKFEKEMDVLRAWESTGPFQKTYRLQMKISKVDAKLGLGKFQEAIDIYASLLQKMESLFSDGV
jgi:hypothetical protein